MGVKHEKWRLRKHYQFENEKYWEEYMGVGKYRSNEMEDLIRNWEAVWSINLYSSCKSPKDKMVGICKTAERRLTNHI